MKVNKRTILLFILFLTLFPTVVLADDTIDMSNNYRLVIEDDADLLTDEEEKDLEEVMLPLTDYGYIAFKTVNSNYSTTASYARNYYHEKFGTQSGTVFIIDMDNRNIYIFSDGANYKVITTSKANTITDNIYTYATKGDYYNCAKKAYEQMNTILRGGKIAEPMKYISNAIVSLILSSFFGFLIAFFCFKIKKSSADEILKNSISSVVVNTITGKKTGTHSVYNPPSSSSSGGGSSGGGGGSSGGGGGHSF